MSPCALRIGAAAAVRPISSSSTATAYPALRTAARSSRSRGRVVIVVVGEPRQLPDRGLELGVRHLAEQHLAVARRVQRDVLAHPVVRLERRGPGDLVEVQRRGLGPYGDVHGLAGVHRELAADRSRLGDQVEAGGGGAGQPQVADAEPVAAAVVDLLDQPVRLQGDEQPERRGLVDAEPLGDLGDAGLAVARQQLEDRERPVHRLHRRCGGRLVEGRHARTVSQRVAYRTHWSGAQRRWWMSTRTSGSSVTCQALQPLTTAGVPGCPGTHPAYRNTTVR